MLTKQPEQKQPVDHLSHQPPDALPPAPDLHGGSLDAALMPLARRPPLVMQRGQGSYLWDESGRRYLDFVQGWAVNTLGHGAPEVLAALAEQSSLLVTASPAFHNRPALDLARLLLRVTGYHQVTFTNSGAEANETAIKLARKWGRLHRRGAFGVVTCENAFHGRTLATMAASGKPGWEQLFPPYPPGFVKVPFGDLNAMERAIDDTTAALMVEPVQGEAGVVVPPSGYLAGLRALADRHGVLLVLDEVQTGCGRTGPFLAQESAGVRGDIVTLGKGLGAGLPISATLVNERAACFEPGDSGSTHGGNALATAVALCVVRNVYDAEFSRAVRDSAQHLEGTLRGLGPRLGASWRGAGLLQALVFERPVTERLRDLCLDCGLLVNAPRPHLLRFMPQLRVSQTEIDEMATRLTQAWARL